ncbi:MAG TPA: type II toxin-antitoxin system VapC family toxin [Thioalkalivibrio sp.]|nr:type II toxin-antitoxin system VapC family toxin [Thioalkalivibrio sp.]
MVAVDTNVLVRLLTGDHPAQYHASRKLFSSENVFVPDSVVLEAEWVLRAAYDLEPSAVCIALRSVFGLENVNVGNPDAVSRALDWHEAGLDFADALHLALSNGQEVLKTFDAGFIKRARALGAGRVEKP